MAITVDGIAAAMVRPSRSRILLDKGSLANAVVGQTFSLWRASGQPGQGAIPTTPAIPTSATLGAISFPNQTAPLSTFWLWANPQAGNSVSSYDFVDRVAHNGGLVLNVTTAQTITGLDLQTLGLVAARRGASNYTDIEWYLEVYTDGGATASNATINVTYHDGTTGNLSVVAVGGTLRAGRAIPLTPQIPLADQGKFIRGINSVTLSASTTVAGNFGFTAVRKLAAAPLVQANTAQLFDWAALGLPEFVNDSCVAIYQTCNATSTGTFRGFGTLGVFDPT